MRRGSRRLLWVIAALAAVLGACDGGTDGGSSWHVALAPQVLACSLITSADAEAALGEPVNPMGSFLAEAKGGDPSLCGFNAGSDTTRTVSLQVRQADTPERARRLFDAAKGVLAGAEDVAGLGDGAFWAGRGVEQLHVLHGAVHLIVTSHAGEGHDSRATAETLARKALARLQPSPAR